ncbi:MAG: hypothetical protein HY518_00180 [Candidatus Aenigmarchaeota archaeon]|nr:hypothetical protein [Candidatus Aenigmarchaeota archaeon]
MEGRIITHRDIDTARPAARQKPLKSNLGQVRAIPVALFLLLIPAMILAQGLERPEGFVVHNGDSILEYPVLDIDIDAPARITRGESVAVTAAVSNLGNVDVDRVRLVVSFPEGFSIIAGEEEQECGRMSKGDSCISELVVSTSLSTGMGPGVVRVKVFYGE